LEPIAPCSITANDREPGSFEMVTPGTPDNR
jgi:hypothetical protein